MSKSYCFWLVSIDLSLVCLCNSAKGSVNVAELVELLIKRWFLAFPISIDMCVWLNSAIEAWLCNKKSLVMVKHASCLVLASTQVVGIHLIESIFHKHKFFFYYSSATVCIVDL
jgi:hypothetical protein